MLRNRRRSRGRRLAEILLAGSTFFRQVILPCVMSNHYHAVIYDRAVESARPEAVVELVAASAGLRGRVGGDVLRRELAAELGESTRAQSTRGGRRGSLHVLNGAQVGGYQLSEVDGARLECPSGRRSTRLAICCVNRPTLDPDGQRTVSAGSRCVTP